MTLRDTELIGKKLVKYGFFRSAANHHNYRINCAGAISIQFRPSGKIWIALIIHDLDSHTIVTFDGHEAVFTPQWVMEEHKKLQAMFKFLRS